MKPFRISAYIGAVLILVSMIMVPFFPQDAPSTVPGIKTPVLAFEFVEKKQEVYKLFGTDDTEARREFIAKMNRGNSIDFLYMVLYSAFLFLFSYQCAKHAGKKYLLMGSVLSVPVLGADILENIQLFEITSKLALGDFEVALYYLQIYTWIKWGGIAVIFLILSFYFIKKGILEKVIAFFLISSFLSAMTAFFHRSAANEVMMYLVMVSFLLLIAYSFWYKDESALSLK